MWELDYKEDRVPKNWRFWIVVLDKTLESPLAGKEIQPVHPKRNQHWTLISRTDATGSWNSNTWATWCEELTHWKWPWCWERLRAAGERATEDEMVRWHHWLNGHEFEQVLGDSEGQRSLACCSPWGPKESDMTVWENKNNNPYLESKAALLWKSI